MVIKSECEASAGAAEGLLKLLFSLIVEMFETDPAAPE